MSFAGDTNSALKEPHVRQAVHAQNASPTKEGVSFLWSSAVSPRLTQRLGGDAHIFVD